MSLKIRSSSCRRGTSGKHSLCSDCRASSSTQTIVHVAESGDRIEVTTTERSSRSSRSNRRKSRSNRTPADRQGEYSAPGHATAYQNNSAESYRDAGRYLGRDERDVEWDIANGCPYADSRQVHEIPGVAYVRPRVHPYEDRYEYIAANTQYVYPPHTWKYPGTTRGYNIPSSYAGYPQPASGGYYPQSSPAAGEQAHGQEGQVNYVYSGTEGPDGENID